MELINESSFHVAWITGKQAPANWSMTCIVKGTFRLVPDRAAVLADEQLELTGDAYVDGNPYGSLRYADDFALSKPRADLMLVVTCYAPDHIPARRVLVRFGIGSWQKTLVVTGDRKWTLLGSFTEPEPFVEMPVCYERAFGGPGYDQNPAGKGYVPLAEQEHTDIFEVPNIEVPDGQVTDPRNPAEPAGFAPISQMWRQRMKKTGTFDEKWQKSRWPWYPDDFDFGFFNAAPDDQQTPWLRGDEEILAENLHREHARFQCRLPGIRPRCFAREMFRGNFQMREVPLVLDTLWADIDAEQLVLVWRGTTPVRSDELVEFSHLFVATERVDEVPKSPEVYSTVLAAALERIEAEEAEDFDLEEPEEMLDEEEDEDEDEDDVEEEQDRHQAEAQNEKEPVAAADDVRLPVVASAPEPTGEELREEILASLRQSSEKIHGFGKPVPDAWAAALANPPSMIDPSDEASEQEDEEESEPDTEFDQLTRDQILQKIARKESLAEHDLTGMDLSGLDVTCLEFRESILQGASLAGAILNGADFTGACLASVDARAVKASGAVFAAADLSSAMLMEADLSGTDMREADLSNADLRYANLTRAQADGAALTNADLSHATLEEARLPSADLAGTRLHSTNLARADVSGAILEGAWARRLNARNAVFLQTAGAGATFVECDFEGIRADESVWENAQLYKCRYTGATLNKSEFSGACLAGSSFDRAELREAVFDTAILRHVSAARANLLEASLVEADVEQADFYEANLYGANLRGTRVKTARTERANLRMTVQTTEAE